MVTIPKNDFELDSTRQAIADKLISIVINKLKEDSIVRIPTYQTPYREDICRYVGKEFKKQGYYSALDFVPNGFRNLIVGKINIPYPSGRLVSIEFL